MGRRRTLTDDQIRAVRAASGSLTEIGREFGIGKSAVSRIRTGALFADVPDVTFAGTFVPYDAQRASRNRRRATRLTDERVDAIRALLARRVPSRVIAKHFDVHEAVVDKLRAGVTYRNAGTRIDRSNPPTRRN